MNMHVYVHMNAYSSVVISYIYWIHMFLRLININFHISENSLIPYRWFMVPRYLSMVRGPCRWCEGHADGTFENSKGVSYHLQNRCCPVNNIFVANVTFVNRSKWNRHWLCVRRDPGDMLSIIWSPHLVSLNFYRLYRLVCMYVCVCVRVCVWSLCVVE